MNPRDELYNQRTGKIARLGFAMRHTVNVMIRDNKPYAEIIAFLKDQGIPDVNEQNLTNWKQGGHQDWLRDQRRLEQMQAKREFALELVKENEGSKLHEATLHIAASQLYEVLEEFDLENLKALLAEKPENYAQIVNSLAKLSKGALEIEKFKEQVRKEAKTILEVTKRANERGGLTAEDLAEIERAAKMIS